MKSSLEIATELAEIAQKNYQEAKTNYEKNPTEDDYKNMSMKGKTAIEKQQELEKVTKQMNAHPFWHQNSTDPVQDPIKKRIEELRSIIDTARSYDSHSSRSLETEAQRELDKLEGKENNECSIM